MSNDRWQPYPSKTKGPRSPQVQRDFTSTDQLALRQSGQVMDHNEDLAQQYRQVGRRIIDPYAARAAEESMKAARYRTVHAGMQVGPERVAYPAPSVAGWRTTQMGTVGMAAGYEQQPWDARHQAGFLETGSRAPGFSNELDRAEKNRWQSGILGLNLATEAMTLHPSAERPYLSMRGSPNVGNTELVVRLTAGSPGGAETQRTFFLGGGFTASFLLDGYQTVRVEILSKTNLTDVLQWAWEVTGLQAGDQQLYLAQTYVTGGVNTTFNVPEGAYEVSWSQSPTSDVGVNGVHWVNPLIGIDMVAPLLMLPWIRWTVQGSQFIIDNAVPDMVAMWYIRPI